MSVGGGEVGEGRFLYHFAPVRSAMAVMFRRTASRNDHVESWFGQATDREQASKRGSKRVRLASHAFPDALPTADLV